MCRDALTAAVTLIPKEGKDRTLCSSFRPITLLNADVKLYAKVLALRLKGKIPQLVHPDQVGFVPGREGRDNGVRSLLIMEAMKLNGSPGLLLSIDAEKAFDRVDWGIMFKTLAVMGIGPTMLKWIKILYNLPTAYVKVNNVASAQFTMKNGTRQGCPLSPLLFVLTLEPLLTTIRKNPDISGCIVGKEEHKLAAFADDVLFYITKPRITIPNLLATIKKFSELSN